MNVNMCDGKQKLHVPANSATQCPLSYLRPQFLPTHNKTDISTMKRKSQVISNSIEPRHLLGGRVTPTGEFASLIRHQLGISATVRPVDRLV